MVQFANRNLSVVKQDSIYENDGEISVGRTFIFKINEEFKQGLILKIGGCNFIGFRHAMVYNFFFLFASLIAYLNPNPNPYSNKTHILTLLAIGYRLIYNMNPKYIDVLFNLFKIKISTYLSWVFSYLKKSYLKNWIFKYWHWVTQKKFVFEYAFESGFKNFFKNFKRTIFWIQIHGIKTKTFRILKSN